MKKRNQAPRKKVKTAKKSAQQKPLKLRQLAVLTMDQLERITVDPATAKIKRLPLLSKREVDRLRVIHLNANQAKKLGPGFPTLKAFLPSATDLQLVQLLDAVPVQWSRKETGPRRGEVTLVAVVNPTADELPAPLAAERRALISKEIASRTHLTKKINEVRFVETNASPALLRKFHRTVDELARIVIAAKTLSKE